MKLISLITTSYNSGQQLNVTFASIRKLKDAGYEFEYILVDADSSDSKTKAIYNSNKDIFDIFISEKDVGVYDGVNKGIKIATGEIVGICHAGTEVCDDIIEIIEAAYLSSCKNAVIAGSAMVVKKNNVKELVRSQMPKLSIKNSQILHETIYVPRRFYLEHGFYDLNYSISSDFDFISRLLVKKVPIVYIDEFFVRYIGGFGMSDSPDKFFTKIRDHRKIMGKNCGMFFANNRYLLRCIKFFFGILRNFYIGRKA